MSQSKHIAIIGAGLMGHGIAQLFACRDYQVYLLDVSEEVLAEAIGKIRANLTIMAQSRIGNIEDIEPLLEG